jgi:hypothetical protein
MGSSGATSTSSGEPSKEKKAPEKLAIKDVLKGLETQVYEHF